MQYKKFEGICPECGGKVYLDNPMDIRFCSRQCETNYRWRKSSFGSTQRKHTWDREKIKKQK